MEGSRKKQKTRLRWDPDAERKLIEIWSEVMRETGGKMVTRKRKEAVATRQLNAYVSCKRIRDGMSHNT